MVPQNEVISIRTLNNAKLAIIKAPEGIPMKQDRIVGLIYVENLLCIFDTEFVSYLPEVINYPGPIHDLYYSTITKSFHVECEYDGRLINIDIADGGNTHLDEVCHLLSIAFAKQGVYHYYPKVYQLGNGNPKINDTHGGAASSRMGYSGHPMIEVSDHTLSYVKLTPIDTIHDAFDSDKRIIMRDDYLVDHILYLTEEVDIATGISTITITVGIGDPMKYEIITRDIENGNTFEELIKNTRHGYGCAVVPEEEKVRFRLNPVRIMTQDEGAKYDAGSN